MANVVFANPSDVSFVEIALQRRKFSHVKDKTVWLKLAEPRPARSLESMLNITHLEIATLESDTFGDDAMDVTIVQEKHQILVGKELACFVVPRGLIWSTFARKRYESVCRQHIEAKASA